MTNLKQLLQRPLRVLPNSLVIIFLIVALLGFADAAYLTIEHYQNVIPPCSVTGGCEVVLTSAYSTVYGIPVSLLGAIYYILVCIGAFAYLEGKNEKLFKASIVLVFLGFIASLWFFFIQAAVLHSYCLYCLGSALSTTILFILSCIVLTKYKDESNI